MALKSINGVLAASIKTYNGIAAGSVKSVGGETWTHDSYITTPTATPACVSSVVE